MTEPDRDSTGFGLGRIGSDWIGWDRIGFNCNGSHRIESDHIGLDDLDPFKSFHDNNQVASEQIGSDRIASDRIGSHQIESIGSVLIGLDPIGTCRFTRTGQQSFASPVDVLGWQ